MVVLSLEDLEQLTVGQPPEERTPQQVFASESPLCDYRPNSRSNKNAAVIGPQRTHETSPSLDHPEARALQEAISAIHDSYGQGHLHLTVVEEYLRKLIINDRVARYLKQYRPEPLIEYQARRLKARGEPDRKARGPTCVAATLVTTNSLRRERAHVHLSRRCRFIIATKSATQLRHLSSRLATRNNRARASLIERSQRLTRHYSVLLPEIVVLLGDLSQTRMCCIPN
jgi:hypothetical protein